MKKRILMLLLILSVLTQLPVAYATDSIIPHVILESYSILGDLETGSEFEIEYTLRNTSSSMHVSNILLTLHSVGMESYPAYGYSNQQYISRIESQETYTGTIKWEVPPYTSFGLLEISFRLSYQSDGAVVFSEEARVGVYLEEKHYLTINEVLLPSECVLERRTFISVKCTNLSDDEFRNVRILFEGNISESEKSMLMGTLRPGTSSVAEGYVTFSELGTQQIWAILQYEDKDGNVIESEPFASNTDVRISAVELQEVDMREENLADNPGRIPILASVAAAIVLVAAVIIILSRKNKAR